MDFGQFVLWGVLLALAIGIGGFVLNIVFMLVFLVFGAITMALSWLWKVFTGKA